MNATAEMVDNPRVPAMTQPVRAESSRKYTNASVIPPIHAVHETAITDPAARDFDKTFTMYEVNTRPELFNIDKFISGKRHGSCGCDNSNSLKLID
ncbi:MAG: hypothetical protein ABI600_08010 [Luteolibacter sp.]